MRDDPLAAGRAVPDAGSGLAARVLDCVRLIPPGRVMTYGDVAEYVGTRAARTIGRILATCDPAGVATDGADGSEGRDGPLPWHRVVRADGRCAEHIRREQLQRLRAEGVPVAGDRVELVRCRWDGREQAATCGGSARLVGYGRPMTGAARSEAESHAESAPGHAEQRRAEQSHAEQGHAEQRRAEPGPFAEQRRAEPGPFADDPSRPFADDPSRPRADPAGDGGDAVAGDDDRVEARARLLPEEVAAGGSDDAERQAQVIIEDSDRRTDDPETTELESTQTPDRP